MKYDLNYQRKKAFYELDAYCARLERQDREREEEKRREEEDRKYEEERRKRRAQMENWDNEFKETSAKALQRVRNMTYQEMCEIGMYLSVPQSYFP